MVHKSSAILSITSLAVLAVVTITTTSLPSTVDGFAPVSTSTNSRINKNVATTTTPFRRRRHAATIALQESRFDVDDNNKERSFSFDPFGLSSSSSSSSATTTTTTTKEKDESPLQETMPMNAIMNDFPNNNGGQLTENHSQNQPQGQGQEEGQEMGLWVARGLLLLVAAIWGTNFACVKYLGELCFHPPCNHPPSEFAFARFGIAAIVSLPLLWKQPKDVIVAGLECGLWIALGYVSQALALSTISAGECAFICSMTVVFVPVVSYILYGKPIRPTDILAGVIAISGVSILEGMFDFNAILGIPPAVADADTTAIVASAANAIDASAVTNALASSSVDTASAATAAAGPIAAAAQSLGLRAGDLIALGQPIGFGFAFTRIEHHQERLRDVPNRVLTIAAAQCVSVGLLSMLWVLYDYDFQFPNFEYMIEPHRIATLAWTGIVTTVFAIYLEGIALQKASATDASIAFSSEPVWASMFGYLLLGETLGTNAYVGGSIIMMACLLGALSDLGMEQSEEDNDEDDDAIDVDIQK